MLQVKLQLKKNALINSSRLKYQRRNVAKKAGVDNLQYQRSSHGGVCRTDSFYTCASADVSLDTVTY